MQAPSLPLARSFVPTELSPSHGRSRPTVVPVHMYDNPLSAALDATEALPGSPSDSHRGSSYAVTGSQPYSPTANRLVPQTSRRAETDTGVVGANGYGTYSEPLSRYTTSPGLATGTLGTSPLRLNSSRFGRMGTGVGSGVVVGGCGGGGSGAASLSGAEMLAEAARMLALSDNHE